MERTFTSNVTFSELLTLDRALVRELLRLADDIETYAAYPSIIDHVSNETAITQRLRDKLDKAITA